MDKGKAEDASTGGRKWRRVEGNKEGEEEDTCSQQWNNKWEGRRY